MRRDLSLSDLWIAQHRRGLLQVTRRKGRAAPLAASGPSCGQASNGPFLDQAVLELGQGAEDMEDQPAD